MKYKFTVVDHDEELKDATTFESVWGENDGRKLAEDAAEHAHYHCDGWEWSYPKIFNIYTMDDKHIGRFSVEREAQPVFIAVPDKE